MSWRQTDERRWEHEYGDELYIATYDESYLLIYGFHDHGSDCEVVIDRVTHLPGAFIIAKDYIESHPDAATQENVEDWFGY